VITVDEIEVTPTERPGAISEMGRRVLDLRERGWFDHRIAKHIGCDRSQITRLVNDPNVQPRHPAGELLVILHAAVMTGTSRWSILLNNLRIGGMTYRMIALRCGSTEEHLKALRADPTICPSYELGERLLRLAQTHGRR
jgi:hypothetical protein